MFPRFLIISMFLFIGTIISINAHAKKNQDIAFDAMNSPLASLYKCKNILDNTQRLACFDKAVATIKTAEEKKEIVTMDAVTAKKIKKESFGFNLPSLPKLALPKIGTDEKVDVLVEKVKSIRKSGHKYRVTLENGQVWKEVGGRLSYIPKGALTATIRPKSMGSYLLSVSNGKTTVKGLRVKRVE